MNPPYKYLSLLFDLASQSTCKDKQVACIIFSAANVIQAVGINYPLGCSCEEKSCAGAIHAESAALSNLNFMVGTGGYALVNNYPCENCQKELAEAGIGTVWSTKPKPIHKNIDDKVTVHHILVPNELGHLNGLKKQLIVAMGEAGEFAQAVSNFLVRAGEREDASLHEVAKELADLQVQITMLRALLPIDENYFLNLEVARKFTELANKVDVGLIVFHEDR